MLFSLCVERDTCVAMMYGVLIRTSSVHRQTIFAPFSFEISLTFLTRFMRFDMHALTKTEGMNLRYEIIKSYSPFRCKYLLKSNKRNKPARIIDELLSSHLSEQVTENKNNAKTFLPMAKKILVSHVKL